MPICPFLFTHDLSGYDKNLRYFTLGQGPYFSPQQYYLYTDNNSSTGVNFKFESQLNYQIAQHWMIGSWMNANNALNYVVYSAGLLMRYTFQPRPLSFDDPVMPVSNWHGQQPFTLF